MNRRALIWRVVAVLFAVVNLAGAVYAAVMREPAHAGLHAGLLIVSLYFIRRLSPQRVASY